MTFSIRPCSTNDEFTAVATLEMAIWDVRPADAITPHMLHVIHHIGGIIMGAFDDEQMVGMAVATSMQQNGHLWSHMAGVLPAYQGQGIGYQIKQVQKEWALAHHYTTIHWSFDPAMRRNAHFNFRQLGATTRQYHKNFYGVMSDGLNAGVPSDRFEAIWDLSATQAPPKTPPNLPFLLCCDDNNQPQLGLDPNFDSPFYSIACPYDFPAIKVQNLDLALEWRHAMRDAFHRAFEHAYHVVDFVTDRQAQRCHYVLHKIDHPNAD